MGVPSGCGRSAIRSRRAGHSAPPHYLRGRRVRPDAARLHRVSAPQWSRDGIQKACRRWADGRGGGAHRRGRGCSRYRLRIAGRPVHGVGESARDTDRLVLLRHAVPQRASADTVRVSRPNAQPGLSVSVARALALCRHDRLRGARRLDRLLRGRWHSRAGGASPRSGHGSRRRSGAVLRASDQPLRSSGGCLCGRVHAERDHAAG